MPAPEWYYVSAEELAKLKEIHTRLHGGTDRERDEGHRLWLICNDIESRPEDE